MPLPDGYGPATPALPPTMGGMVDPTAYRSGIPGPNNLSMPSGVTAQVDRVSISAVLAGLAVVAQPALAAPYAAIPVASFGSHALFLSGVGPFAIELSNPVHSKDVLRINRFSVALNPPAGRVIIVRNAYLAIVQPQGDINVPLFVPGQVVATRNTINNVPMLVAPAVIRGTDFNLGGVEPAIDEIDICYDIAVVDGGGNVIIVPDFNLEFEIFRGANS